MIHVHGNPTINGVSDSTGWKLHFDPIDNSPKTMDAIESHLRDTAKVQFKGGRSNNHGEGKSYTAYPQSLEERDRIIAALENKNTGVSHLLAPANPVEGNVQFSSSTTGRFTTGYNHVDPVTGEVNWGRTISLPNEAFETKAAQRRGGINQYIKDSWNTSGENKAAGWIPLRTTHAEMAEDITALKANHPAIHELMVGKPGYNSPYQLHLPGVDSAPVRPTVGIPPATTAPKVVSATNARTAEEITSNKGDALAQQTTEDQQKTVQEDLESSAGEAGAEASAETLKDKLLEKGQEKSQEVAKDKVKEVIKEKTNGGVRVRKTSTTRFYRSDCSFCPNCC